jgi:hypothetical protein
MTTEIRARIAALEAESEAEEQAARRRNGYPEEDGDPRADMLWSWDRMLGARTGSPEREAQEGFSLDAWLAEGLRGIRSTLAEAGLDQEFWGHMRAAEREVLLAWRCLIDARLRRWEERAASHPPNLQQRQDIEIDFDE